MWKTRIFDTMAVRDKSFDSRAQFAYLNIINGKSSTRRKSFSQEKWFFIHLNMEREKKERIPNVPSGVK